MPRTSLKNAGPEEQVQEGSGRKRMDREARVLLILSFVIGALVGLVVVAFILLTGRLAARMYPSSSAEWRRVVIPVAGALFSGYLLFKYFPDARGSGIPQAKFALFINDGFISLRTVLGKFLCCSISLASGIALGREGPSVQIGAGMASELGRRFGLSKASFRQLLPMGCSAALAAAFNTPIAAVLFSLEEIMGDLHAPVLGSIVISSATSWMVLHLILGDQPLFHVPVYHLVNPVEFLAYAVLGVAGGIASVSFVKLLLTQRLWFRKLPRWSVWMQPAVGGLMVGIMALWIPEVMGVGYGYVERVLSGEMTIRVVLILIVLKIVATATCYSSGNAGGIFGPSLFIGAMVGGAVGSVVHHFFPLVTAGPGAYALVGMGAAFAGIIRTPFTSVLMIFELTRDYTIIVPVMIANMISYIISLKLQPEPIYEALARQEGVFLPEREATGHLTVATILQPFEADLDFDEAAARSRMRTEHLHAWPIADHGCLRALARADQPALAVSHVTAPAYVHPDQPLGHALERMGSFQVDVLPVVSRADLKKIVGVVTMRDVLIAYGVDRLEPALEES